MKILFLHGWHSVPGGVKPTYLKNAGHDVVNPKLDDDDFKAAVKTAQAAYDQHRPDVIVGSSRGGAVAMNIESVKTPLVLLCPAWKNWGTVTKLKMNSVILHSKQDEVIPFAESEELITNSGLPTTALIEVGTDHRLANPEPLKEMLLAVENVCQKTLVIRPETPTDYSAIRQILIAAFADHPYSHQTEHLIVEGLRADSALTI